MLMGWAFVGCKPGTIATGSDEPVISLRIKAVPEGILNGLAIIGERLRLPFNAAIHSQLAPCPAL
jgi:hypothetical protein